MIGLHNAIAHIIVRDADRRSPWRQMCEKSLYEISNDIASYTFIRAECGEKDELNESAHYLHAICEWSIFP